LQTTIPHNPYVDLLPFPSVRDRLLKAGEVVNAYEMWADLTGGDVRVWGARPWEKRGWEVGERFARKWWWVLDQGVLDTGNFWREARGERSLSLEGVLEGMRRG